MIRYLQEQIYRFKYSPLPFKDKLKCAYWDLVDGLESFFWDLS